MDGWRDIFILKTLRGRVLLITDIQAYFAISAIITGLFFGIVREKAGIPYPDFVARAGLEPATS